MLLNGDSRTAAQVAVLLNSFNNLPEPYSGARVENSPSLYLTAIAKDIVFGCVAVEQFNHAVTQIKHLCVLPAVRHNGAGTKLVQWALKYVKTPFVLASIRNENLASRATFRKMGFIEITGKNLTLAVRQNEQLR